MGKHLDVDMHAVITDFLVKVHGIKGENYFYTYLMILINKNIKNGQIIRAIINNIKTTPDRGISALLFSSFCKREYF